VIAVTPDINDIIEKFPNAQRDSLIPMLQEVQERHGYLSREAVVHIGNHLKLPASKIYGVATFYNQFRFQPLGQFHIQVCRGTACHVKGSESVLDSLRRELEIEPGNTTRDGLFSLEVVACIGACGLAPVININGEFHAGVTTQKLTKILNVYRRRAEADANGEAEGNGKVAANTCSEASCRCHPSTPAADEEFLRTLIAARQLDTEGQKKLAAIRRQDVAHPTVFVGTGTCGLGAGAAATIAAIRDEAEKKNFDLEIVEVGCIGLCSAEPLLEIQAPGRNRVVFKNVTADKAPLLLDVFFVGVLQDEMVLGQHRGEGLEPWPDAPYLDEHPFFAPQTRWVLKNCGIIDPTRIDEYVASGGYQVLSKMLAEQSPDAVCDAVEASGLRGRGGGGFPTGRKWRFARQTAGELKYLVCNADEGDPGAFMDRAVIEGDPHRLVEGMAIAAYAIGASKAYVYIRAEYPLAIRRLQLAIEQAKQLGLLGDNILGSDFSLEIIIKTGAGAFVCGEETALIHSIEGKRGMPRPRPPFPAVKGLFGKPTIINNVETLANLPGLLERGAEQFAAVGTDSSKGTKVFALSGNVSRTGLVEVAMGTSIREVVMAIGGGIPDGKQFKAVQIGGPSGGCIPDEELDIQIDYESLKTAGAMMGSGGLVVMDEDTCMVDLAKFFMKFIQMESCGKCIPCREGTRRLLETLEEITRSRKREQSYDALDRFYRVMSLEQLASTIKDTSLCGLGQTSANPILSTLRRFPQEYEAHVYERKCPAKACSGLVTYRVEEELCKGCTLCLKRCPTDAIFGSLKHPHQIDEEKCIGCGQCLDVCRVGAIFKV